MESITLVVTAASGLHARPATMFVKAATRFQSDIYVAKNDKTVDGKKLLAVLTLGIKQGETITISADGPDKQEALAELKRLFDEGFAE